MADSNIPIQPSSAPVASPAPVLVKTFQQVDELGNVTQTQAVMLVDEFGRYQQLMTEATGRRLVASIRELHDALISAQGGMLPSANETISE
jgi:hypothetical protein